LYCESSCAVRHPKRLGGKRAFAPLVHLRTRAGKKPALRHTQHHSREIASDARRDNNVSRPTQYLPIRLNRTAVAISFLYQRRSRRDKNLKAAHATALHTRRTSRTGRTLSCIFYVRNTTSYIHTSCGAPHPPARANRPNEAPRVDEKHFRPHLRFRPHPPRPPSAALLRLTGPL